jgi:hypothetical protein
MLRTMTTTALLVMGIGLFPSIGKAQPPFCGGGYGPCAGNSALQCP